MTESLVPAVRTTPTMAEYIRAVFLAWPAVETEPCTKAACAVLWAQYMIETGGKSCFGFNLANAKRVPGDGHDYHMLKGVWEGLSASEAGRLVAAGQATYDTSEAHKRAVAPRVAVVFEPPHPATHFRAFPSLDVAMLEHLALLRRRFSRGWPGVLAGDVVAFARGLHAQRYFTASPEAYAAGMRAPFAAAMASDAFERVRAETTPTEPPVEPDTGGPVHGTDIVDGAIADRKLGPFS